MRALLARMVVESTLVLVKGTHVTDEVFFRSVASQARDETPMPEQ